VTTDGKDILWQPNAEQVAAAEMTRFRSFVNRESGLDLAGYDDLYRWSVTEAPDFWRSLWSFCEVTGDGPGSVVVEDFQNLTGARWFPEARLNYAENLLQGSGEAEAIVFRNERGDTERLTFDELRAKVANFAGALQADGVGPGDRVAGFLPNLPETVIAMLATSSLGAVWSSCSPDFGVQGVLDRFSQIEPTVLVCADGYFYGGKRHDCLPTVGLILERLSTLRRTVVVPYSLGTPNLTEEMTLLDDYLAMGEGAPLLYHRGPFSHPLFIMFSSGTTGLPKCMVHSVGGTLLQHLKEHRLHCDLHPQDRFFYFTTCGWMMWNWLVSGLATGACIMLYDGHPLKPETVLWDFAAEEGFTVFGTSAKYIDACQKAGLQPGKSHGLPSLRCLLSTGSPLAAESFDYVYRDVKADVQLSSISGGTDIISCFVLGNPVLPVRRGLLQCRGLGMKVEVFDGEGKSVMEEKGELVCTAPFVSMPTGFWNDPRAERYHQAYFNRFENVWCHGDFAEITADGGMIIHGRSDTVLNPGGVRIGTAEIYRVVNQFEEVVESLVVGQNHRDDVRIVLFVALRGGLTLDQDLEGRLRERIRAEETPRHVPSVIRQVPAIPRTVSGKIVELAVRNILHGQPVRNRESLANPESLDYFCELAKELS
jgi:acetoacetyl-CoA synthetase